MEYAKEDWKVEVDEYDGTTNIATKTQIIAKMCYDDQHTLKANAQLISAAPELYEALLAIINSETISDKDNFNNALEAMSKAEGK